MTKGLEKRKHSLFLILVILAFLIISSLILKNAAVEILSSATISKPLTLTINQENNLSDIRVYISSFKGVVKIIPQTNNSQWRKSNHWVTKIWVYIPEKELQKIKEINVTLGEKVFIFNKSQIAENTVVNESSKTAIFEVPSYVRTASSLVPKLKKIINWPGDFYLIKKVSLDAFSLISLLLVILILLRKKLQKISDKLTWKYIKSEGKNKFRELISILKTQYVAIVLIVLVVLIFYPPGQGNRGGIENIRALIEYSYYIVLNLFSIYNQSKIVDFLQFSIGAFLIFVGIKACMNFEEKSELKEDKNDKDSKNDQASNSNNKKLWILTFLILLLVSSTLLFVHLSNRNNHFQESDSSVVYPAIYNFPEFAYKFSFDFYSVTPLVKKIKDKYIDINSGMDLPHPIKSFFALPFGSTYSSGVGFFYGLVSNENSSFQEFISNTLIITITLFFISSILLFFILKRIKISPLISLFCSLLFIFSISIYSYAYSLYGVIWNIFTGLIWLTVFVMFFEKKRFLGLISIATGILVFFNYLIVFYWVSIILVLLFNKQKLTLNNSMKKIIISFLTLFLIAVLLGVLGYAPSRHILFLVPILFVMVGIGLEEFSLKYNKKIISLIFLVLIILMLQFGAFSVYANLKNTSDKMKTIIVDNDVDKIIIQDSSYELVYKNWSTKTKSISAEFADPEKFRIGETYVYISQTIPFEDAYNDWLNYEEIKIETMESYENISNVYFIAYNPYPEKFKHSRPNSLFYTKFKVISLS